MNWFSIQLLTTFRLKFHALQLIYLSDISVSRDVMAFTQETYTVLLLLSYKYLFRNIRSLSSATYRSLISFIATQHGDYTRLLNSTNTTNILALRKSFCVSIICSKISWAIQFSTARKSLGARLKDLLLKINSMSLIDLQNITDSIQSNIVLR